MKGTLEKRAILITPKNVKIGDWLVGKDKKGNVSIGKITSNYIYGEGLLTAEVGNKVNTSTYANAIVLKNDGTYLIGGNIQKQLTNLILLMKDIAQMRY